MASDLSAALGADIFLAGGDITFDAYGDVQLVTQLDLVAQRLYLKALPDPGSILLHPELGAGLASAVQSPLTDEGADRLAAHLQAVVQSDPAVASVVDVLVDTSTPRALVVTPVVIPVGGSTPLAVPLPAVGG